MRLAPLLFLFCLLLPGRCFSASLVLEPDSLDLGHLKQQQVLSREVTLTNKGSDAVSIVRILSDCACTIAEPAKKTLAPGASTTLQITVETKSLQGNIEKRILIQSSGGEVAFPISMSVSPFDDWLLSPVPLVLPPSHPNQEVQGEINATYTGSGTGRVLEAQASQPWIMASVDPIQQGKSYRIRLLKLPEAPTGNHSVSVILKVQGSSEDVVSFSVIAAVTASTRIVPNPVILPTVSPGQKATAAFRVLGWEGKQAPEVQITRGKVTPTGFVDAAYTFEITVEGEGPGTSLAKLSLLKEGKPIMDTQVVVRVMAPAGK